jgi:hypothetical protein
MLPNGSGLEIGFLSFQRLKPNPYPWQKGNAAMRVDRRDELKPKRKLFRL